MKKPGDTKRTITVERNFTVPTWHDVTARAVSSSDGPVTAELIVGCYSLDAAAADAVIVAIRKATEWAFEQREKLIAERTAPSVGSA